MAKLIRKLDRDKKAYIGLLSPEEIREAKKLQQFIQDLIPDIETKLLNLYGKRSIEYAYEFGTVLKEIVEEFEVHGLQRKDFWKQIRDFASQDKTRPIDRSDIRTLYEYYYILAHYNLNGLNNMNWGEWSQLLDTRGVLRKEERIIDWIVSLKGKKISRDEFRIFMIGVRVFYHNKNTAVFEDKQLFAKYNEILKISINWIKLYNQFFTQSGKEPTKARKDKPHKYKEKYFKEVLQIRKGNKKLKVDEVCITVFKAVYCIN
ncbi:hypothetical protein GCM10011351_26950 [Paraliobacillus quinghaiensis]|uniref:Uncharacterized protein n=1 Tax=Paraliobacillus quinghaiensis TaxID=470815 RepID=A0A917TUU8_9BACI|nr:hypothetical protein [Paraliobacillus quinghaiensis]GGM39387.1 hypothetical protein GCM10011351_26950 [Paraliobacillus quinghaiensis]